MHRHLLTCPFFVMGKSHDSDPTTTEKLFLLIESPKFALDRLYEMKPMSLRHHAPTLLDAFVHLYDVTHIGIAW